MPKRKPSKAKYQWVYDPPKAPKPTVPAETKRLVQEKFDEVIETVYKPAHILHLSCLAGFSGALRR